jgi:PGF-pre-PGF domain-containing protein
VKRGSMAYKRYIKRGKKTYGPYIYSSKKIHGKVISTYEGKVNNSEKVNIKVTPNNISKEKNIHLRLNRLIKPLIHLIFGLAFVLLFIFLSTNILVNADPVSEGIIYKEYDNTTQTLSIKVNDSYFWNGTGYEEWIYGPLDNETFRDYKGTIYRYSGEGYFNIYSINDSYIGSFAFGITGTVGGTNYTYSSLNFTWIWTSYYDNLTDEYIFTGYNNWSDFNWTQIFYFYPDKEMKIENVLTNNLGNNITNTKFWYINTFTNDYFIEYNGTRYYLNESISIQQNLTSIIPDVNFGDDYVFNYSDVISNGFDITNFYIGSGNAIGVPSVNITAVGITKGNGNFTNGTRVAIDPSLEVAPQNTNISVIQLTSPLVKSVPVGDDVLVAELMLKDYVDDGGSLVDSMDFHDLNNNSSIISKTIRWKYGIDYQNETCDPENISICFNTTETNWTEFTLLSELPSKDIKIGLFTNTFPKEKVEWVPTIEGFEINEWASWSVSYAVYDNVNLPVGYGLLTTSGVSFNGTGSKMYVLDGSKVDQYTLSTPWNVSTATYDNVQFSFSSQTSAGAGIFFNGTGDKMYIIATSTAVVYQYTLSDPWNISSAIYDEVNFSVASQDTAATDVFFKPEGDKMYVAGVTNDRIFQYTLSNPWNVSSATYDNINIITTGEGNNQGLFFNSSGDKMYFVGSDNDMVFQYTLSDPWNLSSATSDNINLSVVSQEGTPVGVFFKSEGDEMYVIGNVNDFVHQYSLSTPFNLSTATYNTIRVSIGGQETAPTGVFFKDDGTKAYLTGSFSDAVHEYNLSTPWDISTASYNNVKVIVQSQDSNPRALFFKPDGAKMYFVGSDNDMVFQYTLSDPWNVSSATYDNVNFSVTTEEADPRGLFFNSSGNKMYIIGTINDSVFSYTLSDPWNISSASYDGDNFNVTTLETVPIQLSFDPSGTKMLILGDTSNSVRQFTLSQAWNVSTASSDGVSFSVSSQDTTPGGMFINSSGNKMYITGAINGAIYQYSLDDAAFPQWSLNQTNSTTAGTNILHSVYWTDDSSLANYTFSFDNGTGSFVNDSVVSFIGATNHSNVTKYVNETIGTTIRWIVYANDSFGNTNVTSTFSYVTKAPTVFVNETGFAFGTIQEAINNATAGQTVVIIDNATYEENITIDKTLNLTSNASVGLPTINSSTGNVISITSSNVNLSNLKITASGSVSLSGISVGNTVQRTGIRNVEITVNSTGTSYGILAGSGGSGTDNFTINNLTLNLINGTQGIHLEDSIYNILNQSFINVSGSAAIGISSSNGGSNFQIIDSQIYGGTTSALFMSGSTNMIRGSTFNGNGDSSSYGIFLSGSSSTSIENSTINGTDYGLVLSGAGTDSTVSRSNINGNTGSIKQVSVNANTNFSSIDSTLNNSVRLSRDGTANISITLLNSTFTSGTVTYSFCSGGICTVYFQKYLDVNVTDTSFGAINGALVNATDVNSTLVASVSTNSSGMITRQNITYANQSNNGTTYTTYLTNHTINVTFSGATANSTVVNMTTNQNVQLSLDSFPRWFNSSTNSTKSGRYTNYLVNWTDDVALSGYIFEFDNGTGTFGNDTFVTFTGTQNWSNVTKYVNETIGSTIRWRVYANDSLNQLNVTSIQSYNTYWAIDRGNLYEFDIAEGSWNSLAQINSTHYLVAYTGANGDGFARVLLVYPNTTVTAPTTATEFDFIDAARHNLLKINETHFVNFYNNQTLFGFTEVLEVLPNATVINYSRTIWNTARYVGSGGRRDAQKVNDTLFLLINQGLGGDGFINLFQLNTDFTVTNVSELLFESGSLQYGALEKINETHYLGIYTDSSGDGSASVFYVNLTSLAITEVSQFEFDTVDSSYQAMVKLNDTHYFVVHNSTGNVGEALILMVNNTLGIINVTIPSTFTPATEMIYPSVQEINDTHVIVTYGGADNDGFASVLETNYSSNTITLKSTFEFDKDNGEDNSLLKINDSQYINAYNGNLSDGFAVVLTVDAVFAGAEDATAPTVTLNTPADFFNTSSQSIIFNATAFDDINLTNMTLYTNTTGSWIANVTNSSPINNTQSNFTVDGIPEGKNYLWNVYACDNSSNCAYATSNRSFNVDLTVPAVSNQNVNDTTITQNDYFCINITVTDAITSVNTVLAEIYNTTAFLNYTMIDAGTTSCDGASGNGVYGVAIQATALGTWNYSSVWANDTVGNINFTNFTDTSIIVTNNFPQWSQNSTSSVQAGMSSLHSVKWTDDTALSGYIFSFDNGTGTFTNDTFVTFTGTTNHSNVTKYVNETIGTTVRWQVFTNDTANQLNYTSIFQYTTTGDTNPTWSNPLVDDSTPNPGQTVVHNVTWADGDALSYVTLEVNSSGVSCDTTANVSSTTLSGTSDVADLSWLVPQACEGKVVSWKQYANDSANQWNATSSQTYTVNNIAPIASFGTNPVNNYNSSSSSVTFELKGSDNLNVSFLRLYSNFSGGFSANQTNATPVNDTIWSVSVPGIADGYYVWAAWVNDTSSSGNNDFTDTNRTLLVDTTNPLIDYNTSTPANNSNLTQSFIYVNVTLTETNFANITYRLFNTSAVNVTTYTSRIPLINFTGLADGEYTFNVTVFDAAGNSNTTGTRTVTLDTTAPTINYVSPTESSGVFRSRNYIDVNVTASDDSLDTITIRLYNSTNNLIRTNTSTTSPFSINYTGLSNGIYFYNVTVNDSLGQTANLSTLNITLDTVSPLLNITYPLNTSYPAVQTALNYTAADTNLGYCWYSTNNGVTNSSLNSTCANITGLTSSEGSNKWFVWANDSANNLNLSSVIFYVDTIAPFFTAITNQTILPTDSLSYDINATDDGVGLGSFSVNNTANFSIVAGTGVITNSTPLPSGYYVVNISVNDTLGNLNWSLWSVNVTPDSINPNVTINAPTAGQTLTSTNVTINISFTDDIALGSCVYNVTNSGGTAVVNNTATTCGIGSIAYQTISDGSNYVLTAFANDTTGNINITNRTFSIDTSVPDSGGGGGGGGSGGGVPVTNETNETETNETGGETGGQGQVIDTCESRVTDITAGATEIFRQFCEETGIKEMYIKVNNEAQNVKITINKYDGWPAEVSVEKTGKVYQYLQIEVDNVEEKLETANLVFKVERSWTDSNSVKKEDVSMFRYAEEETKWNELETEYTELDDIYFYYETEIDGFSYFAVAESDRVVLGEPRRGIDFGAISDAFVGLKNFLWKTRTLIWVGIVAGLILIILVSRKVMQKRESSSRVIRHKLADRYKMKHPSAQPVKEHTKHSRVGDVIRSIIKYNR